MAWSAEPSPKVRRVMRGQRVAIANHVAPTVAGAGGSAEPEPGGGRARHRRCSAEPRVRPRHCVRHRRLPGRPPEPQAAPSGANTGGSNRTVYSRRLRPRAQLASTRIVTKGSTIGAVDVSVMTSRPSAARDDPDLDPGQKRRDNQGHSELNMSREAIWALSVPSSSGGGNQLDFSIQRGIEARLELDGSQAQCAGKTGHHRQQRRRHACKSKTHQDSRDTLTKRSNPFQIHTVGFDISLPSPRRQYNLTYKCSRTNISAIWTLLVAAPLRTLSETIHRSSPRSCEISSRIRPT